MRLIDQTTQYRRDLKREAKGQHRNALTVELVEVVSMLASDTPLPEKNRDHALTQNWNDHRECHVKPDLLLIYKLPDAETLRLVRLGSHAEIFR
jgi:mRNA interferase YafQ